MISLVEKYLFFLLIFVFSPIINYAQLSNHEVEIKLSQLIDYRDTKGHDYVFYQKLDSLTAIFETFVPSHKPSEYYLISKGEYAREIAEIDFENALIILKEVITESKKQNLKHGLAFNLHALGTIYALNNENKKAIEIYMQTIKLFEELEDWSAYAWSLIDIGNTYNKNGYNQRALTYYDRALETFIEKCELVNGEAVCYQNMGIINSQEGNYQLALEQLNKSKEYRILNNQQFNLGYTYDYIAEVFNNMQMYDSAEYYFLSSIKINEQYKNEHIIINSYRDYASFLYNQGKEKESLVYFMASYHQALLMNNIYEISLGAGKLGEYYRKNNQSDSAIKYLEISYQNALLLNNNGLIEDAASQIVKVYKSLDLASLQIPYYEKLIKVKDYTIRNSETKIQLKNEIEARELEKQLFESNKIKQNQIKYGLITIIGFILPLLLLIFINRIKIKKQNVKIERTLNELQLANTHRDRTFSIIAHDLKGPIGSVLSMVNLIIEEDMSKEEILNYLSLVQNSLSNSSNLLNNLLSWARIQEGNHQFEAKQFDLYKALIQSTNLIEETAISKNIEINLPSQGKYMINADYNMVSTIIRNLINNAIKFSSYQSKIQVKLKEKEKTIQLSVKDSGVGMSQETLANIFKKEVFATQVGTNNERGSGLGLKLVNEFVLLNKGSISVKSELSKGTIFTVSFPKAVE